MSRSADVERAVRARLREEASTPPDLARVRSLARSAAPLLPEGPLAETIDRVAARLEGLGPLDPLLADPAVTEVMVNGGGSVWIEREGVLQRVGVELREDDVLQLIERVVAPLGRHVDRLQPIVDARLPDGSRVHAIVRPLAVDGPNLTIRRFGARPIPLRELCGDAVAALLRWAVEARANVLVSGGASAGKTTLLNALAALIPAGERVVTVEDAAELRLPGDHVVRLESRPPNAEGIGEVGVRDLVRSALRMRPDRIVVGEIRGGEALDMLQAMNTGHDGSLSTCHANSPSDALRRVETLVLMGDVDLPLAAVREQIASAIDVVVHLVRRVDGTRRVVAVAEVEPNPQAAQPLRVRSLAHDAKVVALPRRETRFAVRRAACRMDRLMNPALPLVFTVTAALSAWMAWTDGRRLVGAHRSRRRLTSGAPTVSGRSRLRAVVTRAGRGREALVVDRSLPAWLDAAARSARAGASLRQALRDAASTVLNSSTGAYLEPFVAALDRGDPLDAALDALEAGPPSSARSIVDRALRLAASVGGPSAAVLDAASSTLHERVALVREVRALSTQARASALVMAAAPVVFAFGAVQLDPRVAAFFGSGPGAMCVLAGLGLDVAGAFWMARIVRAGA